jgi:hypothetical protein
VCYGVFVLRLPAMTVTVGARRHPNLIAFRPALDEKGQYKQRKDDDGGSQHKNDFRHRFPLSPRILTLPLILMIAPAAVKKIIDHAAAFCDHLDFLL